jgi:CHASE1-domain containing sensor protein
MSSTVLEPAINGIGRIWIVCRAPPFVMRDVSHSRRAMVVLLIQLLLMLLLLLILQLLLVHQR